MRYFHFLLFLYAIITLDGQRPSAAQQTRLKSAPVYTLLAQDSTHHDQLRANSLHSENPIANHDGVLNTSFEVVSFAVSIPSSVNETAIGPAIHGAYYYSHSGVSPPPII